MSDNVIILYGTCPGCHGCGYWLVPFIKKDGTDSKRCKRFTVIPRPNDQKELDDTIPF